jgi:hypothetical protein
MFRTNNARGGFVAPDPIIRAEQMAGEIHVIGAFRPFFEPFGATTTLGVMGFRLSSDAFV